MKISSPRFSHHGSIPKKYTCDGENVNPPLEFSDIPLNAKSLVLIMDDPDVPAFVRKDQMWVHWVVYDITPQTTGFKEASIPPGIQGKGTGGKVSYEGPCPPDREHRYFFKLYALDTKLELKPGATKEKVEASMQGHVIGQAELIGLYCR